MLKAYDFDGLKAKIDYYIQNSFARESMRLAGHERVKKDHTYTNRLKDILAIVEGI